MIIHDQPVVVWCPDDRFVLAHQTLFHYRWTGFFKGRCLFDIKVALCE